MYDQIDIPATAIAVRFPLFDIISMERKNSAVSVSWKKKKMC